LQPLPYELWIELLLSPSTDAANALTPFKSLFTAAGDNYLEALSLARVSTQNAQLGLTGSGITCSPVGAAEVDCYLAYLRQVGWLAAPEAAIIADLMPTARIGAF
jgi:hypothetical protein